MYFCTVSKQQQHNCQQVWPGLSWDSSQVAFELQPRLCCEMCSGCSHEMKYVLTAVEATVAASSSYCHTLKNEEDKEKRSSTFTRFIHCLSKREADKTRSYWLWLRVNCNLLNKLLVPVACAWGENNMWRSQPKICVRAAVREKQCLKKQDLQNARPEVEREREREWQRAQISPQPKYIVIVTMFQEAGEHYLQDSPTIPVSSPCIIALASS